MVHISGEGEFYYRGSSIKLYINSLLYNRSVHNVRIERLWVDVTAQIGASWAEAFTELELTHGLDINNSNHIWLLHHLFLQTLNQQLQFFAESWNHHRIQIRNGPNRSPIDMFGFDMLVHGVRGDQLPQNEDLTEEEIEVHGVDWAALQDDHILRSVRDHSTNEGSTSWIGNTGPPSHLNEVPLEEPIIFQTFSIADFNQEMSRWVESQGEQVSITAIWVYALALVQTMYGNGF